MKNADTGEGVDPLIDGADAAAAADPSLRLERLREALDVVEERAIPGAAAEWWRLRQARTATARAATSPTSAPARP